MVATVSNCLCVYAGFLSHMGCASFNLRRSTDPLTGQECPK